jgi:serine/threonine protein kinase
MGFLLSTGVILYVIIAAAPPFRESALEQNLENVKYSFRQPVWAHTSPAVQDLIRGMLNPNADERLTCDEALAHKWFDGLVDVRSVMCVLCFPACLNRVFVRVFVVDVSGVG